MTASEFLIDYVKKHGWYSVTNIFHDNEASVQPHAANGYICASESLEMLFTTNKIDYENTDIVEMRYLVSPYHHVDFEQTIACYPFEHIQRWDAMLFEQCHHYNMQGFEETFPIPTIPSPSDIEAIELDPETGLNPNYPSAVLRDRLYTDRTRHPEVENGGATEISVIDLFPDMNYRDDKFMGLRIKAIQDFMHNQKLFCQRCNTMFGVSDCI